MPEVQSSELKLEVGHILFIDLVGYSKLLITEQSEQMQTLREIMRGTEQFRIAEAEDKLLRLRTGDGGALVFRNSREAPVLCALEISRDLKRFGFVRHYSGGPVRQHPFRPALSPPGLRATRQGAVHFAADGGFGALKR